MLVNAVGASIISISQIDHRSRHIFHKDKVVSGTGMHSGGLDRKLAGGLYRIIPSNHQIVVVIISVDIRADTPANRPALRIADHIGTILKSDARGRVYRSVLAVIDNIYAVRPLIRGRGHLNIRAIPYQTPPKLIALAVQQRIKMTSSAFESVPIRQLANIAVIGVHPIPIPLRQNRRRLTVHQMPVIIDVVE